VLSKICLQVWHVQSIEELSVQLEVVVVYLFQQSRQNIPFQHNKFNKARQPEGQMPIMSISGPSSIFHT